METMRKLTIYLHNPEERWLSSATMRSTQSNIIPMVGNGQFWQSPIPVNEDGQYLWAAPMANFSVGCADPTANNFSSACDLSLACTYDVVFSVDMNTTDGTTGVAWAGTINGWNNTSHPMK